MTTTTTTEQTTTLTTEAAESLTTELRTAGVNVAKARQTFTRLIKAAKEGNAHGVLGYASWTAYVADVFSADTVKGLAAADREYLTAYMAGEGMSSRAVARVLGVSQSTAARMIRQAEESGDVAKDRAVTGTDGKDQTAKAEGKGRAKGAKAAKPAKAEADTVTIATADTHHLASLAGRIVEEMSNRWAEGDESAEAALRELTDALAALTMGE